MCVHFYISRNQTMKKDDLLILFCLCFYLGIFCSLEVGNLKQPNGMAFMPLVDLMIRCKFNHLSFVRGAMVQYDMTCFGHSSVGVYAVGFTTCFCLLTLTFLVPLTPNLFSFGRSEFVFINPNSKGQCGCGESFMTTDGSGATKKV